MVQLWRVSLAGWLSALMFSCPKLAKDSYNISNWRLGEEMHKAPQEQEVQLRHGLSSFFFFFFCSSFLGTSAAPLFTLLFCFLLGKCISRIRSCQVLSAFYVFLFVFLTLCICVYVCVL